MSKYIQILPNSISTPSIEGMPNHQILKESVVMTDSLEVTLRYTFTTQFLEGASIFIKRAKDIEDNFRGQLSDELRTEHRSLVATAIMQCSAALETEAHEICTYGPGSHRGSDGTDNQAHQKLAPLADFIDKQSTLDRYEIILRILQKDTIEQAESIYQNAKLLVSLRNELTHYKSVWTEEIDRRKLFKGLETLRLSPPTFSSPDQNFFPHRCLGAACGTWAIKAAVEFLDAFYQRVGIPSRLDTSRKRILL